MRALFDVHAPKLDLLEWEAARLAATFFSNAADVNFTVEPVAAATVNERNIAGEVLWWYQEFVAEWHLKKDTARLLNDADD